MIAAILLCTGCAEESDTPECIPQCTLKQCGPDGCGGICGVCTTAGTQCNNGLCSLIQCMPNCTGKQCGDNGCGGICGTCINGQTCNPATYHCENTACIPNCQGKMCGDDGCGGSCGSCQTNQTCISNICIDTSQCIPNCTGKTCGDNGCGGSCGTCQANQTCISNICIDNSQCIPNCAGKQCGDNGCGGSCGSCQTNQTCISNICIDNSQCIPNCAGKTCGDNGCGGSCGTCQSNQTCQNFQCVTTPTTCTPSCSGTTCGADGCGGKCVCVGELLCDPSDNICKSCVPSCQNRACGGNGCGGSCGSCSANETCNDSTGQCMPYRVKGRLWLETQTVYYDAYTLPQFDKNLDIVGKKLPLSLRDASGKEIATTTVNNDGTFEMQLSRLPIATDWISIVPIWYVAGNIKVAVLKAATTTPYPLWEWTIKLSNYVNSDDPGDLGDVRITVEQNSGGLYLYQLIVQAFDDLLKYGFTQDLSTMPSIAVIWAPGMVWECGTCYYEVPTEVGKTKLHGQIQVTGAKNSESAWGAPTILHEFGHYILFQKKDTTPGGQHYMSGTSNPKLAWSEGWATFYSLMMMSFRKNSPVTQYWRILTTASGADGSYWLDYAHLFDGSNMYSILVPQPKPDAGMKQDVSEAWVSYLIWELFDGKDIADPTTPNDKVKLGAKAIFDAISSERYLKKYYTDTRCTNGTDLIDFVDALICKAQKDGDKQTANDIMDLLIESKFPYDRTPYCP